MTPAPRVALVTGANRGIGLQTAVELARKGLRVVLGSRDPVKGENALAAVRSTDPDLAARMESLALDVADDDSVHAARAWIKREHGRLDVLVNNAAVLLDDDTSIFDVDLTDVRATMETNFYGPLRTCRAFLPMMFEAGYGRVVNVSSEMGQLSTMGGGSAAYRMSKSALNAMTVILSAETRRYPNVKINCCCPGWVRTDMGGPGATKSVAQGADTVVWLAVLPDNGPTGGFFQDRKRIAW